MTSSASRSFDQSLAARTRVRDALAVAARYRRPLLLTGLCLPIRRVPWPALAVGAVVAVITAAALLNLGMPP
jgi:hypothetical protein